MVIKFENFGFYRPTIITFYDKGKEKPCKITFLHTNVEIIAKAINGLTAQLGVKPFFITSPKLYSSITQRTLPGTKSVHELFKDYSINIEEGM